MEQPTLKIIIWFIKIIFHHLFFDQTQGVDIQTKLLLGEENEKDIEFYFFDAGGHPIFKPIIEGVVMKFIRVICLSHLV